MNQQITGDEHKKGQLAAGLRLVLRFVNSYVVGREATSRAL